MSQRRRIARYGTNPVPAAPSSRGRTLEDCLTRRERIHLEAMRRAQLAEREAVRIDRAHRGMKALVAQPPAVRRWEPAFVGTAALVLLVLLLAGVLVLVLGGRR